MLNTMGQRGFTIVELLVGITLAAVLLGLGAPAMSNYLQNSKLATVASMYFSGLQLARAEAIRRNVRTEFALTDDPISTPDIANALTLSTGGGNWVVRAASGPSSYASAVEAKSAAEGRGGAGSQIVVTIAASGPGAFDGEIPFNGFGRTADNTAYTVDIKNPTLGQCAEASGPVRCRRIIVSAGGQMKLCDPAAPSGDSRACQ